MNKIEAMKIARTISNQEIIEMFERAKGQITDWSEASSVNPRFSKGAIWNILTKNFSLDSKLPDISKRNMIWEFGDFLDDKLRQKQTRRKKYRGDVFHEKPVF